MFYKFINMYTVKTLKANVQNVKSNNIDEMQAPRNFTLILTQRDYNDTS